MRTLIATTSFALVVAAGAAGCKKSQSDKCAAAWDEAMALVEAMSKQLGDGKADKPTAADKKEFMDKCLKLPPEAVECMSLAKAMDPKCAEIMEKAEASAEASAEPMKIEWEEKTLLEGKVSVRVPKGWKQEDFMGVQFSPEDSKLSFWNNMTINSNCGGMCDAMSAADWDKRFEENELLNLKESSDTTIEKNEPIGTTGRVVMSTTTLGTRKTLAVLVALYQDNDDHYYTCKAELSRGMTKNLPDFEKACREMKLLVKPGAPAPTEPAPAP